MVLQKDEEPAMSNTEDAQMEFYTVDDEKQNGSLGDDANIITACNYRVNKFMNIHRPVHQEGLIWLFCICISNL